MDILKIRQSDGTWMEIPALIGSKGDPGRGIERIEVAESDVSGGENVITVILSDGTSKQFVVKNGSASDAQADWNESDETSPSYIHHKPFGDIVTEYLSEVSGVTSGTVVGNYIDFVIGETYTVTFDGVEYECFALNDMNPNEIYLGRYSVVDNSPDDDTSSEPFCIVSDSEASSCVMYATDDGTHAVSVSKIDRVKIQEKYLPDFNLVKGTGNGSLKNIGANTANGEYSFAEGRSSTTLGDYSHAEGYTTFTSGTSAHAEGCGTHAKANSSHAEGAYTSASSEAQHVQGRYNIEDENGVYAHIVGNGEYNMPKSNAHTLDWDGNAWFAGDVYTGSTSGKNRDDGSKKLATETFVTEKIAQIDISGFEANSIKTLEQTTSSTEDGGENVWTATMTDGTSANLVVHNGNRGTPGQDGADGTAATISVGTITSLPAESTPTVTNSGTASAAVLNFGIPRGRQGESVTISSVTRSAVDGGENTVTFSDGNRLVVQNGSGGTDGQDGTDGQRGTGILKVTTAPSSYTTAIDDYTPKYRMDLSTIKTQSGVEDVLLGDIIQYSYYQYLISYLDSDYAYISATRTSLRGATGATGTTPVKGTDYYTDADKTEMVTAVKAAMPTFTLVGTDEDDVEHTWTLYGVQV